MSDHTKGEWKAEVGYTNIYIVASAGNKHSAVADIPTSNDNAQANAHLIASAPDLYEACQFALQYFLAYDIGNKVVSGISLMLSEALLKADGGL